MIKKQKEGGRVYSAICASPGVVFGHHGILGPEDRATAYPSFVDRLPNQSAAEERVVVNGNCITSRSPGTAVSSHLLLDWSFCLHSWLQLFLQLEFSIKLVEVMCGKDMAKQLADAMLIRT